MQVKIYDNISKGWMNEEDLIMIKGFEKYGRRWKYISRYLPGRS